MIELTDMEKEIMSLRADGMSYSKIALRYSKSIERMRQIYIHACKKIEVRGYLAALKEDQLDELGLRGDFAGIGLSRRACNCLLSVGIKTKKQAREAIIKRAVITEKNTFPINMIKEYGPKTHREVCAWVGVEHYDLDYKYWPLI